MQAPVIFVTGISTEVGKTICSAIITEALEADYFKPVQAGDLHHSDADKIRSLINNRKTHIHSNAYALKTPMSPHAAAAIDGVNIRIEEIKLPETTNTLVVEGAGGLFVPLNQEYTIFDLIKPHYKVVVVSRHYLGSINHTLMTLKILHQSGIQPAVVFNGNEHKTTEDIIQKMSTVKIIGRMNDEPIIDRNVIRKYADEWRTDLKTFVNS